MQAAKAKARGYRTTRNLIAMAYLLAGKLDFGLPIPGALIPRTHVRGWGPMSIAEDLTKKGGAIIKVIFTGGGGDGEVDAGLSGGPRGRGGSGVKYG